MSSRRAPYSTHFVKFCSHVGLPMGDLFKPSDRHFEIAIIGIGAVAVGFFVTQEFLAGRQLYKSYLLVSVVGLFSSHPRWSHHVCGPDPTFFSCCSSHDRPFAICVFSVRLSLVFEFENYGFFDGG